MIISGNDRGCHEKIFINVVITRNKWVDEVNNSKPPIQLRGLCVSLIVDPAFTSDGPDPTTYKAPLGIAAGLGQPENQDHMHAIGILESNLLLFSGSTVTGGGKKTTPQELLNVWVLCQTYGHADRIWTDGNVTSTHAWLYHAQAMSGVTKGTTPSEVTSYPGLSGVVKVEVTDANPVFTIDLRGNSTDSNTVPLPNVGGQRRVGRPGDQVSSRSQSFGEKSSRLRVLGATLQLTRRTCE